MKALRHVLSALQILLLFGAAALYYLCQNSMGVMRYIVYINRKWQAALPWEPLFPGLPLQRPYYQLLLLFCAVLLMQLIKALLHSRSGQLKED